MREMLLEMLKNCGKKKPYLLFGDFGKLTQKMKKKNRNKKYEPELGQVCFGCPTSEYQVPEYAQAAFDYILEEIRRVFWNVNQERWDYHCDPKINGIVFRPYYWGNDEIESSVPNFKFGEVEIRWYKYPGRGMSTNVQWDANRWSTWMEQVLKIVRDYEKSKLPFDYGD